MHVHKAQSLCEFCGGAHPTSACQVGDQGAHEQGQFQGQGSSSGPPPTPEGKSNLEDMVARLLANSESQNQLAEKQNRYMEECFHTHETELRNQKASIQTIENQVGQIAELLSDRPPGGLPSNTEPNPKAHVKAITLRSGRGTRPDPHVPVDESSEEEVAIEIPDETPSRGLFKQLHINLPFVEALAQMPKYARFLKDILTNKRKLEELSQVTLNEECLAVIQNKLPEKRRDPGSFTIPCLIGSLLVSNALADLGASINLMPYAVFAKLELGEPTPTCMSIQLADRSVKYPLGIVENVLVKVDRFVFPVDFMILDMDEDKNVPIILGRPFLATAKALIDVYSGRLTLRVDEEEDKAEEESLDTQIVGGETFDPVGEDQFDEQLHSQESYEFPQCSTVFAMVNRESEPIERPSIEDPPSVELKELLSHLERGYWRC
ncbi:hypothetical protein L1987_11803 [Smallanthus sonchifolius]|uniref:Uncharacterized protein n=1 Tax=Smallanthus sonchifolius TaxID=185202 RepID=A0ACB9JCV6_9ASTR|nr:hypothetical protein L1987_11803 [Smallanthus sonchifolius]